MKIIAIGASTGGTEALHTVLSALPADVPPILIVQHMPRNFTEAFARRLDQTTALKVSEAVGGETPQRGCAYLAPGHLHLLLRRRAAGFVLELSADPPVSHHRPSADALFFSVAEAAGPEAIGVILTGMGKDGAKGLLAMREKGAWTIGQDEQSCVVYGMPRAAFELGALSEVAPLAEIAARIAARS
ncbi:CheB methylesterase domain-containing protein [Sulfuricystis multivorans]|uniref:CheB methylesterase domain-containing protein n=1 Tax=Sulfuricystis multivorans TaxID=2211108 RepID=UPI000F83D5D4|nr:CheB methylesterase domain-containing protein [Sulfuricystis multivorans]